MLNEKSASNANRPYISVKVIFKKYIFTRSYRAVQHISSKSPVPQSGLVPTFIGISRVSRACKACVSFPQRIIGLQRALAMAGNWRKEISEITKECFQCFLSLWPALVRAQRRSFEYRFVDSYRVQECSAVSTNELFSNR